MLPAGSLVPNAWLCRVIGAAGPGSRHFVRVSPANRLKQALRPQERHLQDFNCRTANLNAVLEVDLGTGFTGHWRKDRGQSDSMEEAFEAIKLPWLFRKAAVLLNNLVVENTEDYFQTTLKAGGIMDVVERYPWTGEKVVHGRRDKRMGKSTGNVEHTPEGPQLRLKWEAPYGGHALDKFTLENNAQTLIHTTIMSFDGDDEVHTYRTVYHRQR